MTKRYKGFTFDEHLTFATILRQTDDNFVKLYWAINERYGKSSHLGKKAISALEKLNTIKCELDTEYHKVCSDENFKKYGHIYFERK